MFQLSRRAAVAGAVRRLCLVVAATLTLACAAASEPRGRQGVLFQHSTIGALMQGLYDGTLSVGQLRREGDFGLGTFHALDGELIVYGGVVYQARSDQAVIHVPDAARTPFATVTRFRPTVCAAVEAPTELEALEQRMEGLVGARNAFVAFCVRGVFSEVRLRSVPAQSKPYPGLAAAAAKQSVYGATAISGTLIGFRTPDYAFTLNVPGYHCHFLSDDRKVAGHVLSCTLATGRIEAQPLRRVALSLPDGPDFDAASLGKDERAGIARVEKGR